MILGVLASQSFRYEKDISEDCELIVDCWLVNDGRIMGINSLEKHRVDYKYQTNIE